MMGYIPKPKAPQTHSATGYARYSGIAIVSMHLLRSLRLEASKAKDSGLRSKRIRDREDAKTAGMLKQPESGPSAYLIKSWGALASLRRSPRFPMLRKLYPGGPQGGGKGAIKGRWDHSYQGASLRKRKRGVVRGLVKMVEDRSAR
jgi:hypothetical protein